MSRLTLRFRGARPAVQPLAARALRRVFHQHAPRVRGEINVVWTDRESLRRMNRRFRAVRRFTDVIAFRHSPPPGFPAGAGDLPFGDLYIAVDQARLNARRFGVPAGEEIVRLAVHGALHLIGHTDYAPRARRKMWAAQEPLVRWAMENAS